MAQNSGHQRRQDVLVAALARGESRTASAKLSGYSLRTVQRRLDDADFRDRVQRFRAEMLEEASDKLGALVVKAVAALEDLLSGDISAVVRLGAAKAVVEFASRTREATLEKRLMDLEARAGVGAKAAEYEERVAGIPYDQLVAEIVAEAADVTRRLGATAFVLDREGAANRSRL